MSKGTRFPPGINPRPASSSTQGKQTDHRQGSPLAKLAAPPQKRQPPPAPPVYRPQLLQRKIAGTRQPPLSTQSKPSPVAPPVYRPQPAPKVLQRKVTVVQSQGSFAPAKRGASTPHAGRGALAPVTRQTAGRSPSPMKAQAVGAAATRSHHVAAIPKARTHCMSPHTDHSRQPREQQTRPPTTHQRSTPEVLQPKVAAQTFPNQVRHVPTLQGRPWVWSGGAVVQRMETNNN
jgi:hypothetical protein